MEYFWADEQSLRSLMGGLEIIERLSAEKAGELSIFLYALTSSPGVLAAAKEAIIDSAEDYWDEEGNPTLTEEDVALPEIAVAIPLSSDALYALLGSGIHIEGLGFAYTSGEGEGIREASFLSTRWTRGRASMKDLASPALAKDDLSLRDYMARTGKGQPMSISKSVRRTSPARLSPARPAAPRPPAPPGELPSPTPEDQEFYRQMGIKSSLEEALDGFLDTSSSRRG